MENQVNAADVLTMEESDVTGSGAGTYTVKYDGKEIEMDLDGLITAAQKGMNYDRVVSQRDKLRRTLDGLAAEKNDPVAEGFRELFRLYPGLHEIPDEIIDGVAAGGNPVDVYRDHLNRQLVMEAEQLRQSAQNAQTAVGTMADDAPAQTDDAFVSGLFGR